MTDPRCIVLAMALTVTGCASDGNFSQREGFTEWFAANPRSTTVPSDADQALLNRYRPRLWVGSDSEGPVSFYRDYIAQGTLRAGDGSVVSSSVSPSILNAHARDPKAVFTHEPKSAPVHPEALGRVDVVPTPDLGELRFLSWHFPFRVSGLPAGLTGFKAGAMAIAGNLVDWHQLDHYTAVTLILSGDIPLALLLQQHNYQRSFIFGCDLPWPDDNRVPVIAAKRSNELYPFAPGTVNRRSVPFMNAAGLEWLFGGDDSPMVSADDITEPAREVDYTLTFLPGTDAFYSFHGFLGAKRLLPGRSGPPGADYDTLPQIKDLVIKLTASNWHEGDDKHRDQLGKLMSSAFQEGRTDEASARTLREQFVKRATSCGPLT